MEAVKVEGLKPAAYSALILFVRFNATLSLFIIRLFVGRRDRLPIVVDLVVVEQHERWNSAQQAANALLTQPSLVRQPVSIGLRCWIVEPGGWIDIHLVADEYGKSRLGSCACLQALDYSMVGVIGDRLINEAGGVLTGRKREARAARRGGYRRLRIIRNDSVRQISILVDKAIKDGRPVFIAEHQRPGPV